MESGTYDMCPYGKTKTNIWNQIIKLENSNHSNFQRCAQINVGLPDTINSNNNAKPHTNRGNSLS